MDLAGARLSPGTGQRSTRKFQKAAPMSGLFFALQMTNSHLLYDSWSVTN
jgi:hypothetical protein